MCTAFSFPNGDFYFGRNMDIEYTFGESVVIMPQKYPLSTRRAGVLSSHFALLGMANVTNNYPLYAEAVNEKGLCMAGLNFPSNARYLPEEEISGTPIAPYELIPLLLGSCENLQQAREFLSSIDLLDLPFLPSLPLAPLHWIVSDASGSLTVERTASGLHIYENPFGVLTNNPPFPFHRENIRNYLHLSAQPPQNRLSSALPLTPVGQGCGAIGLPGDFSPVSRFVKTYFCKENSHCAHTEAVSVAQIFHILDSVAMVRGTVLTPEGKEDITSYSCCINATAGIYYYKTYENSQITKIALTEERKSHSELIVFPLRRELQVFTE